MSPPTYPIIIIRQSNNVVKIHRFVTALRAYFEPPLAKIEKVQQHLRFLQQQQEIALKLKKAADEIQKKKAYQIQKILKMEEQAKAEQQRLEKSVKEKLEFYKRLKEKYQKLYVKLH